LPRRGSGDSPPDAGGAANRLESPGDCDSASHLESPGGRRNENKNVDRRERTTGIQARLPKKSKNSADNRGPHDTDTKTNTQMKRTSRRRVTNPTDRKPVTDEEQNNRAEHSNIQNKIY